MQLEMTMIGDEYDGRYDRDKRLDASGAEVNTPPDLVFDFTNTGRIDLAGMSLLFTARELASEEDRLVWVAGLPAQIWEFLRSLGLEGYFKPFPSGGSLTE